MKIVSFPARSLRYRSGAFTLIQLLLVLALIGILSALMFPVMSRARASAYHQKCDVKLKSIALALDAFKQERGTYPRSLEDLTRDGFLKDADALHCSSDPREGGSYNDFYVVRAPGDSGELPVVCCPFHEDFGNGGGQARLGRFTTQFATRPAVLSRANGVDILHPGDEAPVPGYTGMELHGGDKIITRRQGIAQVTFADQSFASVKPDSEITVLQSFVDGQSGARLYTIVRQLTGEATYTVNHGSRFDVATPTATAGARGTKFTVRIKGRGAETLMPENTNLMVLEGKVVFTDRSKSGLVPQDKLGEWINVLDVGGLLRWLFG